MLIRNVLDIPWTGYSQKLFIFLHKIILMVTTVDNLFLNVSTGSAF